MVEEFSEISSTQLHPYPEVAVVGRVGFCGEAIASGGSLLIAPHGRGFGIVPLLQSCDRTLAAAAH